MPRRRAKPRYLETRRNRDGSKRYYWCPKDQPAVRLSDDPGEAWQEAGAKNEARDLERLGLAKVAKRPGTISALISLYRSDPDYTGLAVKTRREYGKCLEWFQGLVGDLAPADIGPEWIQAVKRDGAAIPAQTNARIRVIRLLYAFGKRNGKVKENPASEFRQLKVEPRDVVWTQEEIGAFLAAARPSMCLAVLLGIYTLQREEDIIALPWTAYTGLSLTLRQQKTGKLVGFSAAAPLKLALDAGRERRSHLTIVISEATGAPYSEHLFRHHFSEDREKAGIRKECQFRDLRRTGAVTLARLGIATTQIAALGGWSISRTSKILETYIPLDMEMASAAAAALEHLRFGSSQ